MTATPDFDVRVGNTRKDPEAFAGRLHGAKRPHPSERHARGW
ncbi:hypothetical protein [Streptomyces sp. NPDC002324]